MNIRFMAIVLAAFSTISLSASAQKNKKDTTEATKLYIDVHHLGPGKVTYEAVAAAHAKDLATEGKYGVRFLKYWVDEDKGDVYCLSSTSDSAGIRKTH